MGAVAAVDLSSPSQRADELAVLSLNSLPLGFRFRPTDEELIDYYLRQKINGNGDDVWVIREIDVCKWEPWDLPDLSVVRNKDPEWFFFCPQDRKYPNGHRLNRATTHGYWKATGKDRRIKSGSTLIGMKKTLVFYTGRAPKGKRTNWVMHEYRPTLKELDGTNPGQNPYVLCRLFKKQDESLEGSNCDEVERTTSTPTTANYSPEEIQSDQVPISSSLATEDDKQLAVINENSEEAVSNIITSVDCQNDRCDAYDAQNQTVKPVTEADQLLNWNVFYDPPDEPLDDRLFSPIHMHMPPEFDIQANNESDSHCGFQYQYSTTETNISDIFNSVVGWDEVSYEESRSQKPYSTLFNNNGPCSDSNVEMANIMSMQALRASYPEEAIDRRIPLVPTQQFCGAITSDLNGNEQESNVGLFENNYQMAFSTDVGMGQVYDGISMGQVYNGINDYEQSRNFNMVNGNTAIRRRTRTELPNMNTMFQPQGEAQRRIRLARLAMQAKDGRSAPEDRNPKPTSAGEKKASENHAAGESATIANDMKESDKTSPESVNTRTIRQQHIATAKPLLRLKDFILGRRVRYTSKASSNHATWSAVFAVSTVALVSLVILVNIRGYLEF